jgi:hypothetical protein
MMEDRKEGSASKIFKFTFLLPNILSCYLPASILKMNVTKNIFI